MKKYLILLSAIIAAVSCNGKKQQEQAAAAQPAAAIPAVEAVTAVRQQVPRTEVFSSTVQAYAVNNIAPQSGGRIKSIKTEVGSFVAKGQVLAEMDDLQLQQARIKLSNDETEYNRLKALLESGGVSQSDFDQIAMALKLDRSNVANLEENTYLRSPISGVVSARNYDSGDMYSSMGQAIFTVQQITPVKLLVGISESEYTKVKVGQKVQLVVDALPGESFEGKIIRIHPTMDSHSHTFDAEVHVANSQRKLRPGMYARVSVDFGVNNSVVVPDASIVKQQGSGVRTVFILGDDNTVTERVVTPGRHFDGKYEILDGIAEGEKLVSKGAATLRDGDKVEVL
ncbi:MAG: efflux RND transporter periplasmic adaptor subunit [Bacteroidales bacterium]|nr:efflux RND transporter periplasmic adaptor subunit [Bacteroidales bacterium]